MPLFSGDLVAMNENHFRAKTATGRKRVLITSLGDYLCPKHAEKLSEEFEIEQVGYIPGNRASIHWCHACQEESVPTNIVPTFQT